MQRLLICTGPPGELKKDEALAGAVAGYPGKVVICGGTTAKIVSRILGRDIAVDMERDPAGLPPASRMEGVEMVTEGVLTLEKILSLLEKGKDGAECAPGTAGRLCGLILDSRRIDFLVGRGLNRLHNDPALPVKLRPRNELISALADLLACGYGKEVHIENY